MILRRNWLAFLFVACAFGIAAVSYASLPARIAVHWSFAGEPDYWLPKQIGAFIVPTIGLALIAALIAITPRAASGSQPSSMPRVYATVVAAIAAIPLYATIAIIAVAMGLAFDARTYSMVGLGLLLATVGNVFGKTTGKSWIGVRLPWTAASDEVRSRANRLTGWLLVIAGLVTIVGALVANGIVVALCVIAATAVVSTAYSYAIARRLRA